jgi:tetratricopeptide (TPR) repeat protein
MEKKQTIWTVLLSLLALMVLLASLWWRFYYAAQENVVHIPPANLDGISADQELREAVAAYNQRQLDKAIAHASEAIRLQPGNAKAYLYRGLLYAKKQEFDKAVADCNQVIRLNPGGAAGYYHRGLVQMEAKEHDKALADLNEALKLMAGKTESIEGPMISVERLDIHATRAKLYQLRQQYDLAIADTKEEIRLRLAKRDEELREHAPAAKAANSGAVLEAIRARYNPEFAKAGIRLGDLHLLAKSPDLAVTNFEAALKLEPKGQGKEKDTFASIRPAAHLGLAKARIAKKEYQAAIDHYTTVIRLDAKNQEGYNGLAWLLATCPEEKARDGPKAIEHATKVCEWTEWKNPGYLDTLAAALAEAGRFDEAVKQQQKAVELATQEQTASFKNRLNLYSGKTPFRDQ